MGDKVVNPQTLNEAWIKYTELFGEPPHGTCQQLAALIEFVKDDDVMVISLETARLLNNAFLPLNPNKLRNAHPDVKAATLEFKEMLARKLRTKSV